MGRRVEGWKKIKYLTSLSNNDAAVRTCGNYYKTGHIKLLLSSVYVANLEIEVSFVIKYWMNLTKV